MPVMHLFAGGMILLLGGVGIGLALAKWNRRAVVVAGALTVVLLGALLVVPNGRSVQCRIARLFSIDDARPPEFLGAWVGWDTKPPPLYCRLELDEDGTGRCAMWYGDGGSGTWRVTRWGVSGDRIEVEVESGDRQERMRGQVFRDALSLKYFGSDGPDVTKNWLGPLLLVPERIERTAKQVVGRALEAR